MPPADGSAVSPTPAQGLRLRPSRDGGVRSPAHDHTVVIPDQRGGLESHPEVEVRLVLPCLGEQVEEVPLGRDRHERMGQVEAGEVGEHDVLTASPREGDALDATVRDAGETVIEPEFIEQPQGRGVDGVAAEVAEEVLVPLEHHDLHPASGEQQAGDNPGGAASADDAVDVFRVVPGGVRAVGGGCGVDDDTLLGWSALRLSARWIRWAAFTSQRRPRNGRRKWCARSVSWTVRRPSSP